MSDTSPMTGELDAPPGGAETLAEPRPQARAETRPRRPVILAVDDEPAVLAAVARDLRRGFGERYRIMRAGSGAEALELLEQIRTRGEQVALLVADQRMPGMEGTDYLVKARAHRSRGQARAADRLRRHRGGDLGDQRGRARLLPAEAVGPAGGAAATRSSRIC